LLDAQALKVQRALPKLQGMGNGSIFFCSLAQGLIQLMLLKSGKLTS